MINLACTHCGHQFELETKEGALCPSCGWSSSVVFAAELESGKKEDANAKRSASSHWMIGFLFFLAKAAGILLAAGLLIGGIILFLNRLNLQEGGKPPRPTSKSEILVGSNLNLPEKGKPASLSAAEKAVLDSKLNLPEKAVVTDQDLKLLQRSIDWNVGDVEKLPSGNWSLQQFKEYIELQEKKFKMPLPRSYKKDLEELFEKTYATAYDFFLAGKLLESRNAYVAALAFPVYANDVRKHRAVVLTMFRSFLNDTIAKIGALNFALARRGVSGQIDQAGMIYGALQQQILAEEWTQAMASIQRLENLLPSSASRGSVVQAPPYAADFAKVDADMQPSLTNLLQVPAWPLDMAALQGDLSVKKMILEPLIDSRRKSSIQSYDRAAEKIQIQAWDEAAALLKKVEVPEDLKQDAEQKLNLIEKLISGERFLNAGV